MDRDPHTNIMIVAGEASGDGHAAKLVRELFDRCPERNLAFFGAAGPKMRAAGVKPIVYSDEMSVVGLLEIARALPMFVRAFKKLVRSARDIRPVAVVLVDFPEFNLRLARSLKRLGITVIYYISPQLWAWRSSRIETIRSSVDLMLTILPFEAQWYADRGFTRTEFVGHPLANEVSPTRSKVEFCMAHDLDPQKPMIALLPGSRRKEVSNIAPVMFQAARAMLVSRPDLQFVVAAVSDPISEMVEDMLSSSAGVSEGRFRVVVGETYDALFSSDAAAVTSGTALLESALIGTPMAMVYKTSRINYAIFRPMIRVEHFGLVNLIAGERLSSELIQGDLTARTLADELNRLLESNTNTIMRSKLKKVSEMLGAGGASDRAAAAILRLLDHSEAGFD